MSDDREVIGAGGEGGRDSFLNQNLQASEALPDEARLLASIWHRDRLIIRSDSIERANDRLFGIMPFVPQYRQLILCGQIPKRARYYKNARSIDTEDLGSIRAAFQQSFAEEGEELGVPPIQVIYFNSSEAVFKDVLGSLDRGWIATTTCDKPAWDSFSSPIAEEMRLADEGIYFIDSLPDDLSLEERILEDTQKIGARGKEFIVQMKQSETRLAFQAIRDEVESGKRLTQSYLSETYHIKDKTLKKIIEIGKREGRLNLSNYIIETHPQIVEFFKELSSINEVSLAAVFDGGDLIGYANFRDIFFPSANFLQVSQKLNGTGKLQGDEDHFQYIELNAAAKDIHIYKSHYLFGFVLEKGAQSALFRLKLEKMIHNLQKAMREK